MAKLGLQQDLIATRPGGAESGVGEGGGGEVIKPGHTSLAGKPAQASESSQAQVCYTIHHALPEQHPRQAKEARCHRSSFNVWHRAAACLQPGA